MFLIIQNPTNEDYIPRKIEWWFSNDHVSAGPTSYSNALRRKQVFGGFIFIRRKI